MESPADVPSEFSVSRTLRNGALSFVGYDLLIRTLSAVLFAPLVGWLSAHLIALSGNGAVSNYDLASFFLSPTGQLYLAVVVSLTFALTFFEFGGLIGIALAVHKTGSVHLPRLLRLLFRALPRLWRLSVRQFLHYLMIAAPCLGVVGLTYLALLTESDINYYLIAKPPAFWITVAVGVVCALVFLLVAGRRFLDWIFSIPLVLFGGATPLGAMRESTRIARPNRPGLLLILLRWAGIGALIFLGLWLIIAALKWVLLGLAGDHVGLVLSVTAVVAVVQFLAAGVVSLVMSTVLACMISRRFVESRPDAALPESLMVSDPGILARIGKLLRVGWVVVFGFAALSLLAAKRIADSSPIAEDVGITAHRGSSIAAPENTMAAIMLAVEEGADYVEIDVQETKDGTVVLVHDKDLLRVFGIKKGIWEVSYDELRDLDSGGWFSAEFSDQRLATLDQVIKAVKGRAQLNIELKFNGHQEKLASEVVRIVRENEFVEDCILTSLDYSGILRARAAGPDFRTGLIVTSSIGDVTGLEGELLSVSAKAVTRDLIDRAHHAGLEVHVWTVNDLPLMNRMIGMGVDQIITDDPKLLADLIDERASLSPAELTLLRLADVAENRL